LDFLEDLCSTISTTQFKYLECEIPSILSNVILTVLNLTEMMRPSLSGRRDVRQCEHSGVFLHVVWHSYEFSSNRVVQGVKFLPSQFGRFQLADLERLKDDSRWLSDSHITFALRLVPFFHHL
jgi:hypothetical protein